VFYADDKAGNAPGRAASRWDESRSSRTTGSTKQSAAAIKASVGGTTVSSRKDFQCLLGERLESLSSEKVAVIKKSSGKLAILDVLSRDYMPSDDEIEDTAK
jgi:hypothetical protein